MRTQQDTKVRMLALDNLEAMCRRASGMSHTYYVSKVSRSRVHVTYSHPDEYGNPDPITAVFPCFPSPYPEDKADNPRVILEPMRTYGGREEIDREIGWQAIEGAIILAPTLWRHNDSSPYRTHRESMAQMDPAYNVAAAPACHSCVVCDMKGQG